MSGRRAGLRFDAEQGVTTEALIFLGDLDPEAVGANIEFATHYEPTPVDEAEQLLSLVPIAPERAAFIDLGSGMGRVVLLAARRPYRQIVGVEISPALHEVARENLGRVDRTRLRCRDIRLVRRDAARYAFPAGDLVVYMYNPFRSVVLERIVGKLAAERSGEIVVLYHTPLERELFERGAPFTLVAQTPFGIVYRRVPTAR
jgi:SAM-dependent methyltransferase